MVDQARFEPETPPPGSRGDGSFLAQFGDSGDKTIRQDEGAYTFASTGFEAVIKCSHTDLGGLQREYGCKGLRRDGPSNRQADKIPWQEVLLALRPRIRLTRSSINAAIPT